MCCFDLMCFLKCSINRGGPKNVESSATGGLFDSKINDYRKGVGALVGLGRIKAPPLFFANCGITFYLL